MATIKLTKEISTRKGKALDIEIEKVINANKGKIVFWGLGSKRPVFFDKYFQATRRRDKTRRRQSFLPAIELLKKVKMDDISKKRRGRRLNELEYEFKGTTPMGKIVRVHIREEIEKKDKKLYLISTFF